MNETQLIYEQMKCKIQTLEKENAELKTKKIPELERKIASIRGSHRVDVKKLNARIEQVERLKKENADLEFSVRNLRKDNKELREVLPKLDKENDELKYKLTKAKEIIKQLMRAIPYGSGKLATESYDKAEQFLSEMEK